MPFPNPATQFRGGERLGKPCPLVGKRRARKLRVALARAEVLRGKEALALLRSAKRKVERPTVSAPPATAAPDEGQALSWVAIARSLGIDPTRPLTDRDTRRVVDAMVADKEARERRLESVSSPPHVTRTRWNENVAT